MEIKHGDNTYQVGRLVVETDKYRLYLCTQNGVRQCLFKIASAVVYNGDFEREAYILKEFERRSDELEVEYAKVKENPNILLNYKLQVPELLDSFICKDQGKRYVNVLAFRKVEDVSKVVPLSNITAVDHLRVDLRSSAWIMGKLLRLLAFLHNEGFSVGVLARHNILIQPDAHYVSIFNWLETEIYSNPEVVPREIRRKEISEAARAVIIVIGGDLKKETIPNDGDEAYERYTEILWKMAHGAESDAEAARVRFYEIVDSFWKREFYQFTTKSL